MTVEGLMKKDFTTWTPTGDVAAAVNIMHDDGSRFSFLPAPQQSVPISLDDRLREVEALLIGWALKVSRGNKSRAAELLNVKRSTLGDRINRCGLGTRPAREDRSESVPSEAAAAPMAEVHVLADV
jgi:DNA-binding NtrC family response regulator